LFTNQDEASISHKSFPRNLTLIDMDKGKVLPTLGDSFSLLGGIFNDTSVAYAIGLSVTTSSTDFPFQNLVFGNLFEFSVAKIS
jgi:hypothetical protein